MKFKTPYSSEIEKYMRDFYNSLPENKRRRYAAMECLKLPYGGQQYIASILGCDSKTIITGIHEIESNSFVDNSRIRQKGGGRKKSEEIYSNLKEIFLKIIDHHIAGDPMNEKVKWLNLSHVKIRDLLEKEGIKVNCSVVARLLKEFGFSYRSISKKNQ